MGNICARTLGGYRRTADEGLMQAGRDVLMQAGAFARVVTNPAQEETPEGWVRIVCFSDTHGLHDKISGEHVIPADILIHAGDFTNTGEPDQVESLARWLRTYPAKHKVVIAGNHDITFQPDYYSRSWGRFHPSPFDCATARDLLLKSDACVYLEDQGVDVMGYRIYGSPWQPEFNDWAFNLDRGGDCRSAWDRIPRDVDILITHGPPAGFGDLCSHGGRVGCEDLLEAIKSRGVPMSVSGHIHEGYGACFEDKTLYVNASTCTLRYRPTNPPIVIDMLDAKSLHDLRARLGDGPSSAASAAPAPAAPSNT